VKGRELVEAIQKFDGWENLKITADGFDITHVNELHLSTGSILFINLATSGG